MKRRSAKPAPVRLAPGAYQELRWQVLQRDGWRCQACGAMTHLEVHHLLFKSRQGKDAEPNLITLCSACHKLTHVPSRVFSDAPGSKALD